jgi:3-isopropylmalate dehydrogenase
MRRIAVFPGDGISREITAAAVNTLEAVEERSGIDLALVQFRLQEEHFRRTGSPLTPAETEELTTHYDALLAGYFSPGQDSNFAQGKGILHSLLRELDLYINCRPVRLLNAAWCPLKQKNQEQIDFLILSEASEGIAVDLAGTVRKGSAEEISLHQCLHTRHGVERFLRYGFEYARSNGLKNVVLSCRCENLPDDDDLWERVFRELERDFPEMETRCLPVGGLIREMIKRPEKLELILTNSLYSRVLADLGVELQGGIELSPEAYLHPGRISLFMPVMRHLPKASNLQNTSPCATILSAGMMLKHLGFEQEAGWVQRAVQYALETNNTTQDLGGRLSTRQVGDFIADQIKKGTC